MPISPLTGPNIVAMCATLDREDTIPLNEVTMVGAHNMKPDA